MEALHITLFGHVNVIHPRISVPSEAFVQHSVPSHLFAPATPSPSTLHADGGVLGDGPT